MKLRFLGKESTPTNSPTLYATENDSYIVQGWIPDYETCIEVTATRMRALLTGA